MHRHPCPTSTTRHAIEELDTKHDHKISNASFKGQRVAFCKFEAEKIHTLLEYMHRLKRRAANWSKSVKVQLLKNLLSDEAAPSAPPAAPCSTLIGCGGVCAHGGGGGVGGWVDG